LLGLALLALPGVLLADPPGRVARLGYFSGSVSFRPAAVDEWARANTTYPLTIGDHLWTDDDARGEIRVGRGSVVRLGPYTAFSFLNLDDDTTQMRVSEGVVAVTVRRLDPNEVVEVDTPNAAVSLLRPGFYRVSVGQQGDETTVTVRDGEVEVSAGGGVVPLYEGETMVVSGIDSSPSYDVFNARGSDAWEDWCLERDRRDGRLQSRRYVSEFMVGYEDLDEYGRWQRDSEYGMVWVPAGMGPQWAPYRYGHWAWVSPWGWTWVDDAPWGFAPFHYGRWARRDHGWFWVPGTVSVRPVYAPALVAFIGGDGFSASLSIGGGGIGWFPLGPREVYVPPYRVSPNYVRSVNVANVTNINQINVTNINVTNVTYVNQRVEGAVTAVARETFVRGRAVDKAAVVVAKRDVQHARVHATVVETLKPQGESVIGEAAPRAAHKPPPRVQERKVVARVPPPQQAAPAVPRAQPAPAPHVLAKPVEAGKPANLKPAREGLPKPREVRHGERPRPLGPGQGRGRREAPGQPGTQPGTQQPPPTGEQERERAREPEGRREPRGRATPQPEATPAPETERERGRGRQRDMDEQRERGREKPPVASPPPTEVRPPERQPRGRATPQPEATPTPEAERERGRGRQRDIDQQRERGREKPPAASPPPTEEKPGQKEKEKGKKPKGKPSPEPTPTPEGNILS
jgi:hypothetical protein